MEKAPQHAKSHFLLEAQAPNFIRSRPLNSRFAAVYIASQGELGNGTQLRKLHFLHRRTWVECRIKATGCNGNFCSNVNHMEMMSQSQKWTQVLDSINWPSLDACSPDYLRRANCNNYFHKAHPGMNNQAHREERPILSSARRLLE